jgi:hypothetical protein
MTTQFIVTQHIPSFVDADNRKQDLVESIENALTLPWVAAFGGEIFTKAMPVAGGGSFYIITKQPDCREWVVAYIRPRTNNDGTPKESVK